MSLTVQSQKTYPTPGPTHRGRKSSKRRCWQTRMISSSNFLTATTLSSERRERICPVENVSVPTVHVRRQLAWLAHHLGSVRLDRAMRLSRQRHQQFRQRRLLLPSSCVSSIYYDWLENILPRQVCLLGSGLRTQRSVILAVPSSRIPRSACSSQTLQSAIWVPLC